MRCAEAQQTSPVTSRLVVYMDTSINRLAAGSKDQYSRPTERKFVSLRKVLLPISTDDLRRICDFFPSSDYEFRLDPTFEPENTGRPADAPAPMPANTAIFGILQKYNRVNLLIPVGAPHMWHAAMERKSCKLTALGEHYRRLVSKDRI